MSLSPGARLGPYEIVSAIGAGGMGEVYRAHDTKLNRQVAIKVLPDAFASDTDRVARFTREAQVLASLNHPNVAQIYGIEGNALVMELVEGEDLAAQIARGPIAVTDALPIASQIIDALEAAHEQGIIHRDLKPANIKVRADGAVKVLDFGLAKALTPGGSGPSADAAFSPTISMHATQMGVVLGTAAYMAPEQAKGKPTDKRADIWAFGVVLYEMLTGRRLFSAETIPETLAHVMTREIELATLPASTPPHIRALLARCLVKDPKQRLRDIGDARQVLAAQTEPGVGGSGTAIRVAPPPRLTWPWVAALALVAAVAAAAAWNAKPSPPAPTVRLSIALPPGEQVTSVPAISRDGRVIAYVAGRSRATSRLYVRALDAFEARVVDSSTAASLPFFSPDGRFVAFFAAGKLWRVPTAGGAVTLLASAPTAWGGTWDTQGRIIYSPDLGAGLWRIPAEGGAPEQLTKPDGQDNGYAHTYPQILPSGDILFSFWGKTFYSAVLAPATRQWRNVTAIRDVSTSVTAPYLWAGYLTDADLAGAVRAVRWKPSDSEARSPETAVLEGVYWAPGSDRSWINVADNGTVVYVPGSPLQRQLVWTDRGGQINQPAVVQGPVTEARLSRDGRRVAYTLQNLFVWVADLATTARTRIGPDQGSANLVGGWFPDDSRILVGSNETGEFDLYTAGTNTSAPLTPFLERPLPQGPMDVAPDGSVVYRERHPVTGEDLWTVSRTGTVSPLVVTPHNETSASVSADARYVAYVSDESGRNEVFAIAISGKGTRTQVSTEGGTGPVWSRDGRELFYRAGNDLMSVPVRTSGELVLGERKKLIDVSAFESMWYHEFDVSADGQRFLFIRADPQSRPTQINVILNWLPELARLTPQSR